MTEVHIEATGKLLAKKLTSDPAGLAAALKELSALMNQYAALLAEKTSAVDAAALTSACGAEHAFLQSVNAKCGAFLSELGLPTGRIFSQRPIVSPQQLDELANTIITFSDLQKIDIGNVSDVAAHYAKLAELTKNVRFFFERINDPQASKPAAEFYRPLHDRISKYPEFKCGKQISLQGISHEGGVMPISSSALLLSSLKLGDNKPHFAVIERVSDTAWSMAQFDGSGWDALPLTSVAGFITTNESAARFKIWTRANGAWQGVNIAHQKGPVRIGTHSDRALVATCDLSGRLNFYTPDAAGKWSAEPSTTGQAPEPLEFLYSGPDGTMLGASSTGKIYSISANETEIKIDELISLSLRPPRSTSQMQVSESSPPTRHFGVLSDHSICILDDKKMLSIVPYDAATRNWNFEKPELIYKGSDRDPTGGIVLSDLHRLPDGRILSHTGNVVQVFSRTNDGWRSDVLAKDYLRMTQVLPDGRIIFSRYNDSDVTIAEPDGDAWILRPLKGASQYIVALPQSGILAEFPEKDKLRVWTPDLDSTT